MAVIKKTSSGGSGPSTPDPFTDLKNPQQLARLNDLLVSLSLAIRNISLGDGKNYSGAGNLDAQWVEVVTPGTVSAAFIVPHGLGRRALGWTVVRASAPMALYEDGDRGSWNNDQIVLKCDTANVAITMLIF